MASHATRQGTLVHSRLSSPHEPLWTDPGLQEKSGTGAREPISSYKRTGGGGGQKTTTTKRVMENESSNLPQMFFACEEKATFHQYDGTVYVVGRRVPLLSLPEKSKVY